MCEFGKCTCGWVLPYRVEFHAVDAWQLCDYLEAVKRGIGSDVHDRGLDAIDGFARQFPNVPMVLAECRDADDCVMVHATALAQDVLRDGGLPVVRQREMVFECQRLMVEHGSFDPDRLAWYADDVARAWFANELESVLARELPCWS